MTPDTPRFGKVDFATWCAAAERAFGVSPRSDQVAHVVDDGVFVRPLHTTAPPAAPPPGFAPFTRGTSASPPSPRTMPHHEMSDFAGLRDAVAADARGGVGTFWIDSAVDGPLQTREDLARLREAAGGAEAELAWDAGAEALAAGAVHASASSGSPLGFADPPGVLAVTGTLPRSLTALERETVALARHALDAPGSSVAVTVAVHPYSWAGAGPAQEIGLALAGGLAQLRGLLGGGITPADAATQIGFSVSVGRELFPEIAKLRALRTAWSRLLSAHGVSAGPACLHAVASRRTLTARDPWLNLLRVAGQTFAAVCGGADVITPACFDEVGRTPAPLGRRLARNTLPILLEECFAGDVLDPAGGSYLVETLTEELARAGWQVLRAIEREGGLVGALQSGWVHDTLAASWESHATDVERGKTPITGVTAFADPDERPLPEPEPSPGPSVITPGHDPWSASVSARLRGRSASPEDLFAALCDSARGGARLADLAAGLAGLDDAAPPVVTPLPRHRDAESVEIPVPAASTPGGAS